MTSLLVNWERRESLAAVVSEAGTGLKIGWIGQAGENQMTAKGEIMIGWGFGRPLSIYRSQHEHGICT